MGGGNSVLTVIEQTVAISRSTLMNSDYLECSASVLLDLIAALDMIDHGILADGC